MKTLAATLLGCLALPCAAQSVAPAAPSATAGTTPARATASRATAAAPATVPPAATPAEPSLSRGGEPEVRHSVIEDDATRIEELRVRGVARQITVTTKGRGGTTYEIITGDGSRDLSDGVNTSRGAAGKRVWRVLSF
jgi:hypothetical protein